ncbi:MAG: FlgD immunoglobulin-like domain containing protein [bacterium]
MFYGMKLGLQTILARKRFAPVNMLVGILITTPAFAQKGSVQLSWQANQESDLGGYKVYYSQKSGHYDHVMNVGDITAYRIGNLDLGVRYYFAVTAYDFSGNESGFSDEVTAAVRNASDTTSPTGAGLLPLVYNYPNPVRIKRDRTVIRYELTEAAEVSIDIFDLNNNLVKSILKNQFKSAGEHTEEVWDGTNSNGKPVAIGVYFCRVQVPGIQRVIKIAVVR